jgi:hypothetical protein
MNSKTSIFFAILSLVSLALSILFSQLLTYSLGLDYLFVGSNVFWFLTGTYIFFWLSLLFLILFVIFGVLLITTFQGKRAVSHQAQSTPVTKDQDFIEESLTKLKVLKDKDLISEEEYLKLRSKLF